jgi:imidazolonepropionase-like amidohydrolase
VHVTAITADFAALKETPPAYVAQRAGKLMEDTVRRGFTTVRDAGGADYGLAMAVEEGLIKGPRLLYCGHALSQTGGHADVRGPGQTSLDQCMCCSGFGHVCDGISEVLKSAREEIRRGATHLKIMASGGVASPTDRITSTQFSEDELRAIIGEAEAAMIPVMAHCYTARAINRAIRCGVTSIEHGNLLDESSVELMLEHGTWLVPTLIIYKALVEEGVEAGMPAHLVEKTWAVLDAGAKALELAYKAGVKIAYGSDLLGVMQRRQNEEFAIRSACVSNADLIRQATVNPAELFRMEDRLGQVKEGFLADLIAVDGNPLDDINVLVDHQQHLKLVMKEGEIMHDRLNG